MIVMIHIIIMVLVGCSLVSADDKTKAFIPGTYIRFSNNEFGKEYDTLIISFQNSSADEYKIIRKWKYEREADGNKMEPEYKRKVTTAIYDPLHKLLEETATGKIYSIDPIAKCLFNGPAKYQKL